jgi:hypothetical protein
MDSLTLQQPNRSGGERQTRLRSTFQPNAQPSSLSWCWQRCSSSGSAMPEISTATLSLCFGRKGRVGDWRRWRGLNKRVRSHEARASAEDDRVLSRCMDMTIATIRPDGSPQATVVSFVPTAFCYISAAGPGSQKSCELFSRHAFQP